MKLIKILSFLILFTCSLFANIKLDLPSSIVKGEALVFTIEAKGSNIRFPNLSLLSNYTVNELSTSSSTVAINSKVTKILKKSYSLYPENSFIFPSLEVEIDGDKYYTKEKKIEILAASKTKSDLFDLSISSKKKDLYVGENFILTLKFKYKRSSELLEINLLPPKFKDFWYEQLNDSKQYRQGEYIVQELNFLLFPLKEGELVISPMLIQAVVLDTKNRMSFLSNVTKALKIYSNDLKFKIKKLPEDIKLIGEFSISAKVDKTKVKKGEAVSYILEIQGSGNFDDLPSFKQNLQDVTTYDNKPSIKTSYKDALYKGEYKKVFSFISNKSFEIPSLTLRYFDKNQNKIIKKKTKKFFIEVENSKNTNTQIQTLQKKEEKVKEIIKVQNVSFFDKFSYFILGVIFTLLILGLIWYVINLKRNKKIEESPLLKRIKKTKSKDELLKLLSKYYSLDKNLDKVILDLEQSNDFEEEKKKIQKLLKNIKIKGE